MMENPEFRQRLQILIGDEKPFSWAVRVGLSKGAFNRVWNKGTIPNHEGLVKIKQVTGVSLDWLLTGEGPIMSASRTIPEAAAQGAGAGESAGRAVVEHDVMAESGSAAAELVRQREQAACQGPHLIILAWLEEVFRDPKSGVILYEKMKKFFPEFSSYCDRLQEELPDPSARRGNKKASG